MSEHFEGSQRIRDHSELVFGRPKKTYSVGRLGGCVVAGLYAHADDTTKDGPHEPCVRDLRDCLVFLTGNPDVRRRRLGPESWEQLRYSSGLLIGPALVHAAMSEQLVQTLDWANMGDMKTLDRVTVHAAASVFAGRLVNNNGSITGTRATGLRALVEGVINRQDLADWASGSGPNGSNEVSAGYIGILQGYTAIALRALDAARERLAVPTQ